MCFLTLLLFLMASLMRVFIKMPLKTHRKIWESNNFISCSKYIAKELLKFYSKRNSISVVETDLASLQSYTMCFPPAVDKKSRSSV